MVNEGSHKDLSTWKLHMYIYIYINIYIYIYVMYIIYVIYYIYISLNYIILYIYICEYLFLQHFEKRCTKLIYTYIIWNIKKDCF